MFSKMCFFLSHADVLFHICNSLFISPSSDIYLEAFGGGAVPRINISYRCSSDDI
jgi:hypothetical protein